MLTTCNKPCEHSLLTAQIYDNITPKEERINMTVNWPNLISYSSGSGTVWTESWLRRTWSNSMRSNARFIIHKTLYSCIRSCVGKKLKSSLSFILLQSRQTADAIRSTGLSGKEKKLYSFYPDYHVVVTIPADFDLWSFQVRNIIKLIPKITYEISAHFIYYLRVATSPQSTQTATAAISTASTGKKDKIESFINNTTVKKCPIILLILSTPRLHGTGSAWTWNEIRQFKDECF